MASVELSKSKKPSSKELSRAEVDAKFLSRGVPPALILEATGLDKMEVTELRALLSVFEEAHEKSWDVAMGPWSHAVQFYQQYFQVTLSAGEAGPREVLIKDLL